jgi:hypothetical protein
MESSIGRRERSLRVVMLLATALSSSACVAAPAMAYSVTWDPSFTSDQLDALISGVADWQAAVPGLRVASSIGSCASPSSDQVCVHPEHAPPDPAHDVVGTTYPGDSDESTILIYVDRIQATGWEVESLIRQTMAHEMGHALGLRHTGRGTLMAPEVPDQAHSVTPADVQQFWAVRGR